MKKFFKRTKNFIDFLRNDDVSMDAKSLYLVVLYAVIVNAANLVAFIFGALPREVIYLCAATSLFHLGILYLLGRFDETDLFKYLVVIVDNFFIFPLFFWMTGDIANGAVLFFPLGIIFTFFLIREYRVYLIAVIELIWYCHVIIMPMRHVEKFAPYKMAASGNIGITAGFLAMSFAPLFIFVYQTVIYERARNELNESSRTIEYARYNKSRFLANVTHEIRTPMNAIIGMNELILREELDPEARELAENIKTSSNQLLKIINNILEFSKLDSNKMELYPVKYDLKKFLTEITDAVSNEYASENIEFLAKIDPNIPQILFGDSIRIKQVFMYLLFSSVHKLPHSRMLMEVRSEVDQATNTVLLSCTISESGFGVSEAEIEAMLSAYTKYDSRQKSDYKGMGLELSICKEILELMGGSLSIKSVEGVGMSVHFEIINYIIDENPIVSISSMKEYNILVYTKNPEDQTIWQEILGQFQLYPNFVTGPNAFRQSIENKRYTHIFIDDMFYPILKDTIKSAQIMDDVYVLTEAGSIYSDFDKCRIIRKPVTCIVVSNALNNIWDEDSFKVAAKRESVIYPEGKVLIVDDSIVNLKVLEGMLQTFEINVTKCQNGAQALDILEKDDFDLIVLDQRMPEMDGIELLHLIRKLEGANAMVPILCATADFGPDVSRMLLNEGFQDYLAKPVRKFYLERMLRKYMPIELAVNIVVEDETESETKQKAESSEEKPTDPLVIDFNTGIVNVGGNKEAYLSVVSSYFKEGKAKIDRVRELLAQKMTDQYVTEVHALKSSSAAIGAAGMSVLFRSLEFAGKAGNVEYIEGNTERTLESFGKLLDVVEVYLKENDEISTEEVQPSGEESSFDDNVIDEMIDALSNFRIKETEEKIAQLCGINFGTEINNSIKEIKGTLEVFDYHKAKELLTELKRRRNESGI